MKNESLLSKFSVPLGLVDYINPILYSITTITLFKSFSSESIPWNYVFMLGALISIICGFCIPTIKLLIGLGKIEFKLPVQFVFLVNSGIFISGLTLFKILKNVNIFTLLAIIICTFIILLLIMMKYKKFNTIAVLIGTVGYMLIYITLISTAIYYRKTLITILYGIAILLFLFLCIIGIKANLKDARVHWLIEISNICCQLLVTIGTGLLV